ncbi:DUF2147 domain-containing protein (plasmid) [Ensifer sp. PDNC004]|uniref:DUF2147 domain-containing protein n=1 Tax=Ensifer sp. PDNC004 TaxID=2811423 RepID=UPI001966CD92|nr:DUF2147 domain-containing protein [Ensifer sp. PDNC004]QRY70742.1 DUF2147 domain-containing protein [Ensifer sp. PDNC004]
MKITLLTALAFSTLAASAAAQQPTDPSGVWMRDDGNARVRIAPCGTNICATNLWIGDTSKGEEAGDRLVMSLTQKTADTLAGTAYDPKRNRTYSITVVVLDKSLVTRGCILGGILCRDVHWAPAQ